MVPAAALASHDNWITTIAGNKGVAYIKPGQVEVRHIEYPTFELRDGAGVNPASVGRKIPHGVILKCIATYLRQRPTRGTRPHHRT